MSAEANTIIKSVTPVSNTNMGYCVRCKDKRDMVDARVATSSTGRTVLQGKCPTCNTKMSRFLPIPNGTKKEKGTEKEKEKEKEGAEPRSPEEEASTVVEENNKVVGGKEKKEKSSPAKKKAPRKKKVESSDV